MTTSGEVADPIARRVRALLQAKIAVTAVGFCLPLLAAPLESWRAAGFLVEPPAFWLRFLGVAYLGMLTVYSSGVRALGRGADATIALHAAVASNGFGGLFLVAQGVTGAWDGFGGPARAILWTFGVGALVLAGLFLLGLRALGTRSPEASRR